VGFSIADVFCHPRPQHVYLFKVPSTAASHDRFGNGASINSLTTKTANASGLTWAGDRMKTFVLILPAGTPPGEYLSSFAGAQFYIGCAQLKATRSVTGTLSPTVKFP
ncbi:hypothetical protein K469DRAFT_593114, partial [Zopfia rhizophila CBS 207.26]